MGDATKLLEINSYQKANLHFHLIISIISHIHASRAWAKRNQTDESVEVLGL